MAESSSVEPGQHVCKSSIRSRVDMAGQLCQLAVPTTLSTGQFVTQLKCWCFFTSLNSTPPTLVVLCSSLLYFSKCAGREEVQLNYRELMYVIFIVSILEKMRALIVWCVSWSMRHSVQVTGNLALKTQQTLNKLVLGFLISHTHPQTSIIMR